MRTKKQLIIECFFPVSNELKRTEDLSLQHVTKHNQLAELRWIKLKLGFPDNERMTNEIGH
jgi:hypothetical protein